MSGPIDWRDHVPVLVGGVVLGHARVRLETEDEPEMCTGRELPKAPRARRLVADIWPSSSDPVAVDDGFQLIEGEAGVVFRTR